MYLFLVLLGRVIENDIDDVANTFNRQHLDALFCRLNIPQPVRFEKFKEVQNLLPTKLALNMLHLWKKKKEPGAFKKAFNMLWKTSGASRRAMSEFLPHVRRYAKSDAVDNFTDLQQQWQKSGNGLT